MLLHWVRHTAEADLSEGGASAGAIPAWVPFLMWDGKVCLLALGAAA